MGSLRVLKVEYFGDKYAFESPLLDRPISIIEGPNGSGKSTFFNLIYFGFGGKVAEFDPDSTTAHKEIMGDTNNLVRLLIDLSGKTYTLTRKIRENLITVFKEGVEAEGVSVDLKTFTLPIYRKDGDQQTFSDWILEELRIPVVEIFQSGRSFKLNFADLSRLIYHNQSPDPHGIYKPADSANFITDSLEIRRAIFQILIGKTLLSLYDAIGRLKLADRNVQAARAIHQEYQDIVSELLKASGVKSIQNIKSIQSEMQDAESQLNRLLRTRRSLTDGRSDGSAARSVLESELRRQQELDGARREYDEKLYDLSREAAKIVDLERVLKDDIARINKVIYTHGQLQLFSSDTCPYCLNSVQRAKYKCVCGHDIEEHDYQRFFYSSAEYLDILRSKTKALETIELAASDLREEIGAVSRQRSDVLQIIARHRAQLEEVKQQASAPVDNTIDQVDEKILDVRMALGRLHEALRLESKLAELQKRLDDCRSEYDSVRLEVNQLDAASKAELKSQLASFNAAYNDMMTNVLSDCRVASIDPETYLPVINNGEYREASANVPKRFLYYLSLLRLSLAGEIPFPRLLLVDTPETAGIDLENLISMLRELVTVEKQAKSQFQVLLSTGVKKYPPEFDQYVVIRLTEGEKLLRTLPAPSETQ